MPVLKRKDNSFNNINYFIFWFSQKANLTSVTAMVTIPMKPVIRYAILNFLDTSFFLQFLLEKQCICKFNCTVYSYLIICESFGCEVAVFFIKQGTVITVPYLFQLECICIFVICCFLLYCTAE